MKEMASCPNCGSKHVTIKQQTNVSWGRAVAGWALFGAIGGAVGAVTGKDRMVNVCLDCGTSWKAADLYKTLQTIEGTTGTILDLEKEPDRLYMNDFISEVGPHVADISKTNKKADKLTKRVHKNTSEVEFYFCVMLFVGCLVVAIALEATFNFGVSSFLISVSLFGCIGFAWFTSKTKKHNTRVSLELAKTEGEKIISESEENLKFAAKDFMNRHPL